MSLQIKVAAFQYPVHREKLAVSSCFKSRSFSLHLLCVQSLLMWFSPFQFQVLCCWNLYCSELSTRKRHNLQRPKTRQCSSGCRGSYQINRLRHVQGRIFLTFLSSLSVTQYISVQASKSNTVLSDTKKNWQKLPFAYLQCYWSLNLVVE